nr:probable sulfate permease C869.05c [Aedes albopictus]XP_029729617.1 probable sulfate permease C869.05c [Aedes albopictus]
MRSHVSPDGSYINEGMNCSSLDITMPNGEPHGGLTGSNEFILSSSGQKISADSRMEEVNQWCQRKAKSACSRKMLLKRLPILRWLPCYNGTDAVGDLVAGITVGLTVIPQALAYSGIAGLPAAVSC